MNSQASPLVITDLKEHIPSYYFVQYHVTHQWEVSQSIHLSGVCGDLCDRAPLKSHQAAL